MGRKKTGKRSETISVSLPLELVDFLNKIQNRSEYVEDAVRRKIFLEANPQVLLREIEREKRALVKKMNDLKDKEEDILANLAEMQKKREEQATALFKIPL